MHTESLTRRDALAVFALVMGQSVGCHLLPRKGGAPNSGDGNANPSASDQQHPTITVIYTGDDGRSHFSDVSLIEHAIGDGVRETIWLKAAAASLRWIELPSGFASEPRHVAPRRQLAVIVQGALEVECADGRRRFGPGSLTLVEDVAGEGHITRVATSPCAVVQIELAPGESLAPTRP